MSTRHSLESCHCFASRRGARQVSRLYDRYLAQADIKSSQFILLMAVSFNPDIQMNDLAELMVMERTTLVRALKPLQEEGWVASRKAESGRAHLFRVTPEGEAKIEQCSPYWEQARRELEKQVGKSRAEQIRDNNLAMSSIAF
jgi:DNA-binding MarR family transcriptional regulator